MGIFEGTPTPNRGVPTENDYARQTEVMFGIEQNSPGGGGMIRQWKDRQQVSQP